MFWIPVILASVLLVVLLILIIRFRKKLFNDQVDINSDKLGIHVKSRAFTLFVLGLFGVFILCILQIFQHSGKRVGELEALVREYERFKETLQDYNYTFEFNVEKDGLTQIITSPEDVSLGMQIYENNNYPLYEEPKKVTPAVGAEGLIAEVDRLKTGEKVVFEILFENTVYRSSLIEIPRIRVQMRPVTGQE